MSDGYEVKADLVIAIQTLNVNGFKEILEKTKIHFVEIKDHNYLNVFHELAGTVLTDNIEEALFEVYLSCCYCAHKEKTAEVLRKQLNTGSKDEEMTPLMLATVHNKRKLIAKFLAFGADPNLVNKKKQNLLHLACSKGLIQLVVFFKLNFDLNINEKDIDGLTPAHQAAKAEKEALVTLLISWNANLNTKDSKSNTLLHYAAQNNSFRIIKILIIRGAKRTSKNSDNKTPYDLAKSLNNTKTSRILQAPGMLKTFNPCKPAVTPKDNSYYLFAVYIVIFISRYLLVIIFMLPRFELELSMPSLLLFILSLAFFIIVSQRDPGYAKKKAGTSMIKLYEIHHFDSICPFCQIKRSSKTRHCQYCERCVAEYDHHCPWIRNCVGAGNFKVFIIFLFICCTDLAYMSTLGMLDYFEKLNYQYRIVEVKSYHKEMGLVVTGICFLGFCFAFPVLILQLYNICKNKSNKVEPSYKVLKSTTNKESTFSLIPEDELAGCCTKGKSLELNNKTFLKTDSFRSIATHNSAKSVYVSRSTRNLNSSKASLNPLNPKVTVDYLGLISPKSDKVEIVEPIESKDSILEAHNIKELISIQEQKRTVTFTKEIFSDPSLSDSSNSGAFSSLSKLLSHFRTVEAKILNEKNKYSPLYFVKKLADIEDHASDCLLTVLEHLKTQSAVHSLLARTQDDLAESQKTVERLSRELKSAKDKNETITKRVSDKGQNLEKIEKLHVLEKVKLEHEIELLREELSKKTTEQKVLIEPKKEPRMQEIEDAYKSLKDKHEKSLISFYRLQMELAETKEKEKLSKSVADSYEELRQALITQIETIKARNVELENLLSCYRERFCMVTEELYSFNEFKSEFYRLRNEKNIIRRKMRQLEIGVVTGGYSNQVVEEFVPANDEVFRLVQNPEKFKSKKMNNRRISTQDLAKINLNTLKPCKPTFASFLKIPVGHVQFSPPYKDWLFVTVRAIFDSKYNEHLLNLQGNTLPLAFPEFVYDWLGHFTVDNNVRSVKQQEWWTKNNADTCRLQLLAGLALPRSKRVWELNTFREFLQEELDLDELAFYLHSRYLLFQGPQLSTSAGKYASSHYVTLAESQKLIQTVMEGLPNESISQLLTTIEEKSKKKPGFIESSFVLRVLLEFYHREKKMKYLAIQELFYRCSKNEFTFDSFKDICLSLDSKLPPYLIAKAYREAFMDGNGFISADVFYVVANNLLFYFMLRLKSPWKIPKLNEYGEIDPYFDEYSNYMATADKLFKSRGRDVEIVSKYIESMGVPEFHRHYLNLELVMSRKYLVMDEFKCWNLADVFKQYWVTVIKAKSVFYEHNGVNPLGIRKKVFEAMENDLKNIVDANKIFIEDLSEYQLQLVKIKILVRRLQKRAKNKPRGISLMKNIVKSIGTLKKMTVPKQPNN